MSEIENAQVGFAPGRYVRLKHDMRGLPAGTRGMISGRVLTRPEDEGKLEVVFRAYIPGSPEYGNLRVPREGLEWDSDGDLEVSAVNADDQQVVTLDRHDEPQHSGAIVAVNYGDYSRQEVWVRSGTNIGNWYPLGGEFGRPQTGWNSMPQHPHWEDVLALGPVTLLVPADGDAYRAGWRNGRRRMVEQMENVADDDE